MWKIPPGAARSVLHVRTVGVTRDIAEPRSPITTHTVWVSPALLFLILSLIIKIILEALILMYDRGEKNAATLPIHYCYFLGHPWKEVVKTLTCNPCWFPWTDWCTRRMTFRNHQPQRTQGESSQEWRRCRRREQWRSSWCRCKRLQERLVLWALWSLWWYSLLNRALYIVHMRGAAFDLVVTILTTLKSLWTRSSNRPWVQFYLACLVFVIFLILWLINIIIK